MNTVPWKVVSSYATYRPGHSSYAFLGGGEKAWTPAEAGSRLPWAALAPLVQGAPSAFCFARPTKYHGRGLQGKIMSQCPGGQFCL